MSTSNTSVKENKTKKKKVSKKTILQSMKAIRKSIYKKDKIDLPINNDIRAVMKWGKFTQTEACLYSMLVCSAIDGTEWFDLGDLQSEVDLEFSDLAEYIIVMDKLLQKGALTLRYDLTYIPGTYNADTQVYIHDSIIEDIEYNRKFTPYIPTDRKEKMDCLSFLGRCKSEKFKKKAIYYQNVIESFYKEDPILQPFRKGYMVTWNDPVMGKGEALLFFIYAAVCLFDDSCVSVKDVLEAVLTSPSPSVLLNCLKTFKDGTSFLLKEGLFAIDVSEMGNDIKIKWGKKAVDQIFNGENSLFLHSNTAKELGVIKNKDIKEKKLFYNPVNEKDVKRLEGLVEETQYQAMRKRLEEKNLPKGLIILLYGSPGTGKTETANQLAKKSGRDLFHLNLQEVRSCWVGESEKNVKSIFEAYRNNRSPLKPILLFNEADGIISKRTNISGDRNSSVAKMENTMQNIILEEMENFDGILILTTNLSDNFDTAFDRRILFKLKFENPTIDIKKKIWKSKMDFLKDDEVEALASMSDLSGGQIENISRKVLLDEILYGTRPDLETLKDFTKKEKLFNSETKRIGFQ